MPPKKRKQTSEGRGRTKLKVAKTYHSPNEKLEKLGKNLSKPFLLDQLPEKIRVKIYSYAGLFRKCPIHLHDPHLGLKVHEEEEEDFGEEEQKHKSRRRGPPSYYGSYDTYASNILTSCYCPSITHLMDSRAEVFCKCLPLPVQLMLVSRGVHDDVEAHFYKSNQFRVLKCLDLGVPVLEKISTNAQAHIKSLEIALGGITNSDFRKRNGLPSFLMRLKDLMLDHFDLPCLSFVFKCEISGLRAHARDMFVDAFADIHRVGKCIISLDYPHKYSYRYGSGKARIYFGDLAQKLVTQMTEDIIMPQSQPFRYFDLPKELRLMVLQQTSLVERRSDFNANGTVKVRNGSISRRIVCCKKCDEIYNPHTSKCYCYGQRSVASSTCTCERSAKSLFLTSKLMSSESFEVFRGSNRFNFEDRLPAVTAFLRAAPNGFLHALRKVDLHYPENFYHYWVINDPSVSDSFWSGLKITAGLFEQYGNLAALELSLHFPLHHDCFNKHQDPDTGNFLKGWPKKLAVVAPILKHLRCLKVFIPCKCLNEEELEKAAMGDKYDSYRHGKIPRNRRGSWPHNTLKSGNSIWLP
ncbi:MAG: hypothetical protein MMC23_001527 [Stictis urceolatum]|nr:hypothetical protein [Stictis urceolata]